MKCRYKEYLKKVELDNKKFIDEMYERLDVEAMKEEVAKPDHKTDDNDLMLSILEAYKKSHPEYKEPLPQKQEK